MEELKRVKKDDDLVVFAVNGKRYEVSCHPCTSLVEFLRCHTPFKSVKLSCGEGGCGACVVLLSNYDPVLKTVESYTVSSCLTLVHSVNYCSITTTEGLGNSKDGFHPIHKRFSGFHASQCGFCTPGMCISLFSALVNAEEKQRPDPPTGFSKLTVSEAEKAISGNLCRCTGYRPIADACKSFAADVDLEDLGINSFWREGESNGDKLSKLPCYNPKDDVCTYPEFLKSELESAMYLSPHKKSWYSPLTLEELQNLTDLKLSTTRTKLVAGNTGIGYYKELNQYENYINLRNVSELSSICRNETGIVIGATVTISKAISALKEKVEGGLCSDGELTFTKIAEHLEKIASEPVRNLASVGGNVVMAQKNHFPSDIVTVLLAVSSTVDLLIDTKREILTLEEFLSKPPLDHRGVLLSIKIPFSSSFRTSFSTETSKLVFETYRAAPRPLGNALPYLNAAFLAIISPNRIGVVINKIQLVFGAFGAKHAKRAREAEEYLAGKILSLNVLYEAINIIRATVISEDGTSDAMYRSSLVVSYLFEFLHPLFNGVVLVSNGLSTRNSANNLAEDNLSNDAKKPALLSSGKQLVTTSRDYYPVGQPIVKSGASIQASGEAVYVDDIPSPSNCLHGAFIYSTKPLARVKNVRFKNKSPPDGVTAVITYNDIPSGGENIGSKTIFGTEPLFADDITRCAGQCLALVAAETQKLADRAASLSIVDYDTDNLDPPILTLEEAVEKSSFFEVPPFLYPAQIGDFSKGMAEADHKINSQIKLGSQYYFYMETQTALAIPDEDSCMVVYSSIQCPESVHSVIARCLGIPEHNVRVITRRVGGGFGGKAIKAMPVATACALAAHKLRRPVRMYLNRKTDMIMAGGRHPMKISYDVGFKSDGKITALHLYILINAGISADISPIMPSNMLGVLKRYDWGALSFDIKVCKTNHSNKSAMRAPGEVQPSFIAEAVMEHVASILSMEVDSVRYRNLHTFDSLNLFYKHSAGELVEYTLPSIWDKVQISSNFSQRTKKIQQFNQKNLWKKKGISRVPIVHEVTVRPTPGKVSVLSDGSIVVEVGGIELGQGLWTKVKQMTAYALGSIQCDGIENLVDKVRIVQADTLSLIQGGFTAGSTTSESSCEAVRICCNILIERLSPLKEKLQAQMTSLTWNTLVLQAYRQAVNLSASSYFVPDFSSMQYLNYGAAVSEVEINTLTGEATILRSDIIYDCGQSLNPAVDLGQIEGAFVQGIGFFMSEEYLTNSDGLVIADSTWTYKIPTIDTIPKQFNVEVLNSKHHKNRVLSSKASGEPPLLLAVSVHCATRAAIKEARKQLCSWKNSSEECNLSFQLDVPATMPVVKRLCGMDYVESYLKHLISCQESKQS
ncbi:indole-3-acetaldehyde oxidase-like [Heracleum sosnowskyi]|uniref:indole-3-acetaldehyde oxidase n=1 Tax=Heracleum sosnowskyi TaxID=360622 RepID=A0AAD8N4G7_9APIA|nr:indole-3-acetaldehyde oxidase-like [Heracleum sosnowskyi]